MMKSKKVKKKAAKKAAKKRKPFAEKISEDLETKKIPVEEGEDYSIEDDPDYESLDEEFEPAE